MTENMKKLFELISQHPELQSKVTEAAEKEQIISFAAVHRHSADERGF